MSNKLVNINKIELISVVIPTYGRTDFILRCLRSVQDQTYDNLEIIIVDDNGKGTSNQLSTYSKLQPFIELDNRLKYIVHEKNMNGSAARNTGINNSKGNYICFLDDDDEFEKDKIEKQYRKLKQSNGSFEACYCGHKRIKANKTISTYIAMEEGNILFPLLLNSIDACTGSTLMINRSILDKVKGFDVDFKRHQDYEFIGRLAYFTNISVISEPLVRINMHPGSYSQKKYDDIISTRIQYNKKMSSFLNKLTHKEKRKVEYNNALILAKTALKHRKFKDFYYYLLKSKNIRIFYDLIKDASKYMKRVEKN